MYFQTEQLIEFFNNSDTNEQVKVNYHRALPWLHAGIDGKVSYDSWYGSSVEDRPSFDYRAVDMDKVVAVMHERIADGKFLEWKALRPWVVADVTAGLPKDEPWIGWEIETGWNEHEDRYKVVSLFNERYMHSCTDDEGYGAYQVELTFSPQTPGFYAKRDNPLHPLLFVANHKERALIHRPGQQVGTHINFSTPAFREADGYTKQRVEGALNNSLASLSFKEKEELFGRGDLYAGCFLRGMQEEESTESGGVWIEGKLFNSTYEWDVAKGYIEVANRLCSVMEQLAARGTTLGTVVVTNFYDVLSGKVSGIETKAVAYLRDGDDVGTSDDYDDYYDDDDGESCSCDVYRDSNDNDW